jgi:hypothetical protein
MTDDRRLDVGNDDERIDHAILGLLLHGQAVGPWAEDELVREIGDRVAVEDALARLHGAGLIHRLAEGFAFPTRAALLGSQLAA